jgi:hypothetical protein
MASALVDIDTAELIEPLDFGGGEGAIVDANVVEPAVKGGANKIITYPDVVTAGVASYGACASTIVLRVIYAVYI